MKFPSSELIINPDGSAFHLHVKPGELAEKIILVGDRARVGVVASFFDEIECDVENREFHTVTGSYGGKRVSVVSTGIGVGNIDIVVNEIDALFNIDFETREPVRDKVSAALVRIGTSGGLQEFTPEGSFVAAELSMGLDGLLHFYGGSERVRLRDAEEAFMRLFGDKVGGLSPYCVASDKNLLDCIAAADVIRGITVTAPGFYGPQGRRLNCEPSEPDMTGKIRMFEYSGLRPCNFEMESSALAGLSALLGHRALTVCLVIANRYARRFIGDYSAKMKELIELVLKRI